MNTNGLWCRVTLGGLVLVILALSPLVGDDTPKKAADSPVVQDGSLGSEADRICFVGVMFVDGKPLVSLNDKITRRSEWVELNDAFFDYFVTEATQTYVTLRHRSTNKEFKKYLSGSEASTASEPRNGPELYTKAWINSKANPMLTRMQQLPERVYRNWAKLSAAEQAEIIEFYRKHGWRLIYANSVGAGSTSFAWENIYEAERVAIVTANAEAFVKSLSTEQRAEWDLIHSKQDIKAQSGGFSEVQRQEINERRQRFEHFKSMLTAEQRAAQQDISDFTKANWN